jgi:hypothetical protein
MLIESVLAEGVAAVARRLSVWPPATHFYLAGGTALALQLGHRRSRDLGLFTRPPLAWLPELPDIDAFLAQFGQVDWVIRNPEQIVWHLDEVSVTLLAYPYGHDFPWLMWHGLAVADARDIAIQKAYTIGRRAHARDYLDLHAVLTRGLLSLGDLVERTQRIYGDGFSPRLFLQQLTYTRDLPDGADAIQLLTMPREFLDIEHDLRMIVRQFVEQQVGDPPNPPAGPPQ